MAGGFTAPQAARLTGVKYDNLDYWATSGFLTPSIAEATGSGSTRLYSFADLVALKTAERLRREGVSLQGLRRAVTYLRARGYDCPLSEVYLIALNGDIVEKTGDELISTLRRPGQQFFAWILDLAEIVEELRQATQVA